MPEFISVLDDTVGIEKAETKLSCRVAGYPPPEIKWLCNSAKIYMDENYSSKFDGTEATLSIRSTQMEDAGRYTCQVTNGSETYILSKSLVGSLMLFIAYMLTTCHFLCPCKGKRVERFKTPLKAFVFKEHFRL